MLLGSEAPNLSTVDRTPGDGRAKARQGDKRHSSDGVMAHGTGPARRQEAVKECHMGVWKLVGRHIDTAQSYANEEFCGAAIKQSGIPGISALSRPRSRPMNCGPGQLRPSGLRQAYHKPWPSIRSICFFCTGLRPRNRISDAVLHGPQFAPGVRRRHGQLDDRRPRISRSHKSMRRLPSFLAIAHHCDEPGQDPRLLPESAHR